MSCLYWKKQIYRAKTGLLSPQQATRLARHISKCQACAALHAQEAAVDKALGALPSLDTQADFNQRLWEHIRAVPVSPVPFFQRRGFWPLGLASTAAALLLAGIGIWFKFTEHPLTPAATTGQLPAQLADQRTIQPLSPKSTTQARSVGIEEKTTLVKKSEQQKQPDSILPAAEAPQKRVEAKSGLVASFPKKMRLHPSPVRRSIKRLARSAPKQHKEENKFTAASKKGSPLVVQADSSPGNMRLLKNKINLNYQDISRLEFRLEKPTMIKALVYSRSGRLVHTLHDGVLGQGDHSLEWNGHSQAGKPVATGVYFLVIIHGDKKDRFKIVVIR